MANIIEIIIKANDVASSQLGKVGKALVAIGAIAIAKQIAAQGVALAKLGMQAQAAEDRFTAFAGGAQRAADILNSVQAATGGTISRMDAMTSSTKLLSMGLASSADEVAKITEMAVRLGDQAQSTGDRVNDFALLLANQSVQRLDNFGISSGKVRARILELQEAMPGLSRETAFMQATMEIGAQSLEKLGDAGLSATESMSKFNATISDLKVTVGKELAPILAQAAENTNELVTVSLQAIDKYGFFGVAADILVEGLLDVNDTIHTQIDDIEDLNTATAKAAAHQEAMDSAVGATVPTLEEYQAALGIVTEKTFVVSDAMRDAEGNVIESSAAWDQYAKATADALPPLAAVAESMERVNRLKGAMGASIGEGLETAKQKLGDLRGEAAQLEGKISDLEGKSYLTGAQQEELGSLRGKLGDIRGEIGGVIEDAKKMAGAFVLSALESQIAADGLWTQAEADMFASTGRQLGMFDEVAAGMISMTAVAVEQLNSGALDATEATNLIIGSTEAAVEKFTTLETAGGSAMEGIASKTGAAIAKLIDVGNQAVIAQSKIDAMKGKDIEINVKFKIPSLPTIPGGPSAVAMASGFDGVFNRPTMAIFGESGPEYVRAVPKSQWNDNTTNTRGGDTFIIQNNAQAAMVMEQRRRNMGLAGRF